MRRLAVSLLLASSIHCGGAPPSPSDTEPAGTTTGAGSSTTAAPVADSGSESGDSTTSASSGTTGGDGIHEWVGSFGAGFGFPYFTACGEVEPWLAWDLPGYEYCTGAPLWLRVRGTVEEGTNGPELTIVELLEGPCLSGSCSDGVVGYCDDFDALCIDYASPCDVLDQDCGPGMKCAPIDAGANHVDCLPLDPDPGHAGEPCQRLPVDTCDLTSLCVAVDPSTGMGVCAPLCPSHDVDACPDPGDACFTSGGQHEIVCVPRCDPVLDTCPPRHACQLPLGQPEPFMCSPLQEALPFGAPCEFGMCDSGLFCAPDELFHECDFYKCCSSFCDPAMPSCPDGYVCDTLWRQPEYDHIGLCVAQ